MIPTRFPALCLQLEPSVNDAGEETKKMVAHKVQRASLREGRRKEEEG
jgi:hypothetical protein